MKPGAFGLAIYDLTGSYALAFRNGIAWSGLNIRNMLMILSRERGPKGAVPA